MASRALGLSSTDVRAPVEPGWKRIRRVRDMTISARDIVNARSGADQTEWSEPTALDDWLAPAERRLDELASLPDNWDSYGGVPISEDTRKDVLRLLEAIVSARDPLPVLVPGSEGSVDLEWHAPGLVFEVEVEPDGNLTAYFCHDAEGVEWEEPYRSIESHVGSIIAMFPGSSA